MKIMKNKLLVFLILLVLVFSSQMYPITETFSFEDVLTVPIVVENKIELLGIITILEADDYFACELLNTIFKRDAVAWFRPYRNHSAIKSYRHLLDLGFSDNHLRAYLMELGNLPELTIPDTLSSTFRTEPFRLWHQHLLQFLDESSFSSFWSREREYYNQAVEQFAPSSNLLDSIRKEMQFLGFTNLPFRWVLSPLIFGNQAILVNQEAESQGMIILGLSDIQNGRLVFGKEKTQLTLIQQDLLQLLVNKVTIPFQEDISKSESLLDPIKELMKNEGINTWQECFNQHLFWSIRLINFEENPSEKIIELQKLGYIYVDDTYQLLQQYEQYRSYFPTVTTFLPRVIQQFNSMARRKQ